MDVVPGDILVVIAEHLRARDVMALASTCRGLLFLRSDPVLWRTLYLRRWPDAPTTVGASPVRWSEAYAAYLSRERVAAATFNKLPLEQGLVFLGDTARVVPSLEPPDVLHFMLKQGGVSKERVGEYLGTLHGEARQAAQKYLCKACNLEGLRLVPAMRRFMGMIRLPGEAARIDCVVYIFAECFRAQNEAYCARMGFEDVDTLYTIAYACIMVNTDQHSRKVRPTLNRDGWVRNCLHLGASAPVLTEAWNDIVAQELLQHPPVLLTWTTAQIDTGAFFFPLRQRHLRLSTDHLLIFANEEEENECVARFPRQPIHVRRDGNRLELASAMPGYDLYGWWRRGLFQAVLKLYEQPTLEIVFETEGEAEKWASQLLLVLDRDYNPPLPGGWLFPPHAQSDQGGEGGGIGVGVPAGGI